MQPSFGSGVCDRRLRSMTDRPWRHGDFHSDESATFYSLYVYAAWRFSPGAGAMSELQYFCRAAPEGEARPQLVTRA